MKTCVKHYNNFIGNKIGNLILVNEILINDSVEISILLNSLFRLFLIDLSRKRMVCEVFVVLKIPENSLPSLSVKC